MFLNAMASSRAGLAPTSGLWCFQNAAKKTPDLGRPGVFLSPEKSGLTGWRRGAGAAVGVTAGVGAVAEFDELTGAAGVAAATAGFGAAAFGAAGFSPLASSQRQVLLLVWPLRFSLQAWRRQAWQQVWRRLLRQPVWPLVWLQGFGSGRFRRWLGSRFSRRFGQWLGSGFGGWFSRWFGGAVFAATGATLAPVSFDLLGQGIDLAVQCLDFVAARYAQARMRCSGACRKRLPARPTCPVHDLSRR
jgi:hypothetical protein